MSFVSNSWKAIQAAINDLKHYGVSIEDGAPGPGSGRYPKGSGENPNQHSGDLLTRYDTLKNQGLTEKEIAVAMNLGNTTRLRTVIAQAKNERRAANVKAAKAMLADGKSRKEVCEKYGINESTLRSWLDPNSEARTTQAQKLADFLKQQVDEYGMIDVGSGVELEGPVVDAAGVAGKLGVSRTKLKQALYILEQEGYPTYGGSVPQATNPGKQTNLMVLCPPGTPHKDIYNHDQVHSIVDYKCRQDENGNDIFEKGFEYPASMDSSRLLIRFRDDILPDGHKAVEMDGTIGIRPGLADLDLKGSRYSQVRILVDDSKYLKGMAFYDNTIPQGYDVVFNTNKTHDQADRALKDIKNDPTNPFGALLKEEGGQYHYIDISGERKLGLINKKGDEGDWGEWSKELPSQFLSKQSKDLMQKQLALAIADKQAEMDEIAKLENPTLQKHLYSELASKCDTAAVDLKAAALPRQRYQVILPVPTLKDNECYAPNFEDGETLALIRFPHAGTFEIPIVKVNNKNPEAINMMGKNPLDAIGINSHVAERLSGADFDGDTVLAIPCNSSRSNVKIVSKPPLKELEGFDPKMEYGYSDKKVDANGNTHYYRNGHEFKVMRNTQNEMGQVSNLITDMTIKGASDEEIARAVRHSMVVIDAEKHKLDYKASEIDNGIKQLKRKWQEHYVEGDDNPHYGASTLISMAKSKQDVVKQKGSPKINQEGKPWYDPSKPEGALIYNRVEEHYTDKHGKDKVRMQESTKMFETSDARTLSSGSYQEEIYAQYANAMKEMGNECRRRIIHTGKIEYNANANKEYRAEVDHLMAQLNEAEKNAPRERKAQLATSSQIKALKDEYPDITKKELGKKKQQFLAQNRVRFGASRHGIDISPREYQAIQAGAISETTLNRILKYADGSQIREYATPRSNTSLTAGQKARIRAMKNSGYTQAQIAASLNISASTVNRILGDDLKERRKQDA